MHLLYRIAALFAFVASVLGCNQSQRSFTERSTSAGVDQLYSKVEMRAEGTHFDCIASQSGSCHYTLFAEGCAPDEACSRTPLQQFALAAGAQKVVTKLPKTLQPCVRQDAMPVDARCHAVTPPA